MRCPGHCPLFPFPASSSVDPGRLLNYTTEGTAVWGHMGLSVGPTSARCGAGPEVLALGHCSPGSRQQPQAPGSSLRQERDSQNLSGLSHGKRRFAVGQSGASGRAIKEGPRAGRRASSLPLSRGWARRGRVSKVGPGTGDCKHSCCSFSSGLELPFVPLFLQWVHFVVCAGFEFMLPKL